MTTLEEVGLWLDEKTGCLVDIRSRVDYGIGVSYNVLFRGGRGYLGSGAGWVGANDPDERDAAATRYATSIITTAKPGEVWEVTLEDGRKVRVMPHVSYGERVEFFGPEATYLLEDILDRRLIITADGEYVG